MTGKVREEDGNIRVSEFGTGRMFAGITLNQVFLKRTYIAAGIGPLHL